MINLRIGFSLGAQVKKAAGRSAWYREGIAFSDGYGGYDCFSAIFAAFVIENIASCGENVSKHEYNIAADEPSPFLKE